MSKKKSPIPKFGYLIWVDAPTYSGGNTYQTLHFDFFAISPTSHGEAIQQYYGRNHDESVKITYQMHQRPEVREGTVDGPIWYAQRIKIHTDSVHQTPTANWLRRVLRDYPRGLAVHDLIATLESRSDAIRLCHANQFSNWIAADDYAESETYLGYRDDIPGYAGCILHAHIQKGDADETSDSLLKRAQHAIAEALRVSPHCSTRQLEEWLTLGRPVVAINFRAFHHEPPTPLSTILGNPIPEESALDLAA